MSSHFDNLDARGTYVDNIEDVRVRAVVSHLSDTCMCFRESPRWDGHRVNPPCGTVQSAINIVAALTDLNSKIASARSEYRN